MTRPWDRQVLHFLFFREDTIVGGSGSSERLALIMLPVSHLLAIERAGELISAWLRQLLKSTALDHRGSVTEAERCALGI